MRGTKKLWDFLKRPQGVWLFFVAGVSVLIAAWWLRGRSTVPDPLRYAQLQFTSGILALTFAATALVRFRGTRDRLPLMLAGGFLIVGVTLASSSLVVLRLSDGDSGAGLRDPMSWVMSRTLLALLFVAALVVERRLPTARNFGREITVALVLVVIMASLLGTVHLRLPADLVVHPDGAFPRPGNLFPAGLFILATIAYHRRLRRTASPFDRSLCFAAALNAACCLAASQSERRLDAPFAFAQTLQFTSYVVLVGGALLDNVRLFESVRQLAVSDSLTGLANYRRLVDELGSEIQRSGRTRRPFALLLFDLDGLKKINDQFGHLAGSRALCRVADVLRLHSRTIDTGARYGGDEFVLILPETGMEAAQEVGRRICERVANDPEQPPISVSAGIAVYPEDGATIETLLDSADRALYRVKGCVPERLPVPE
jgi:diguanylate cyclase (GGDEF)-like protein